MEEWLAVVKISVPVILIDETLKFVARKYVEGQRKYLHAHWIVLMWAVFFGVLSVIPL